MPTKTRKRKQGGGGKTLFPNVASFTEENVERIFCNGKMLSELAKPVEKNGADARPFFFLKWAPMGSGKSSEKVLDIIKRILDPNSIEECADISSDKLVENLLPFRFETIKAKMKNVRFKADLKRQDWAHAKTIIQELASPLRETNTMKSYAREITGDNWPSGKAPSKEITLRIPTFMESMLQKQIKESYEKYYRQIKGADGKTLREKVLNFFTRAYSENVNMIYETAGLGYGDVTDKAAGAPALTVGRLATRSTYSALQNLMRVEILKNTFSDFFGELLYAHDFSGKDLIPIGINTEGRKDLYIPDNYRIVIIFPIVPIEELQKRGYVRAYKQLENHTLYDITPQQKAQIVVYINTLLNILFARSSKGKPDEMKLAIDSILTEEFEKYTQVSKEITYVDYLNTIGESKMDDTAEIEFPFFRLTSGDLEKSVAQAFQYSVDYFLRQYIQIGRIEQVIYVKNF